MSGARGHSPIHARGMEAQDARRIFIEEYQFLRGCLMSHEAIARTLGMSLSTLQTRVMRYDCQVLSVAEQRVSDHLDELIEAGEPFTLEQVSHLDNGTALWLISTAMKRGRIRSSQSRAGRSRRASVYTPVKAET